MPLVFQQNINDASILGVWKIEESLAFFDAIPTMRTFGHEAREIGHRSCRQIIRSLAPEIDLQEIVQDLHGRPVHASSSVELSFSHTRGWSAALITKQIRCGVDIETIGSKASLVQSKFLTEEDNEVLQVLPFQADCTYTLAWSIKETVFKWYGRGAVDFKKHIRLLSINTTEDNQFIAQIDFSREKSQQVSVHGLIHPDYVLSWLLTDGE